MIPLVGAAEMRALDRATIGELGLPGLLLMETAGIGVVQAIERRWGRPLRDVAIGIVCGGGNNAGDGFVAARHLVNRGARVTVYGVAPRSKLTGDAATMRDLLDRFSIPVRAALDGLEEQEILVDALLGTGLKSDVTAPFAETIERMNRARALRVAVDIPSGLDADTGHPRGACLRADLTVTMGLRKIGLVTAPGFELAGEVTTVDIGIPDRLLERAPASVFLIEASDLRLPAPPASAHKGTFGHLLVVAGSEEKPGAALLAGEAALRGGAGLVTLAARKRAQPVLAGRVLELMTACLEEPGDLEALVRGKRAIAIGPGIPTDPTMRALVRHAARVLALPMVIDADGLNALEGSVDELAGAAGPRLLTPHPGEMARLLGCSTEAVQSDRIGAARTLASRSQAVVVLKGARTVVAAPDGIVTINPTTNPALASAGTGDTLTGLCGALLAQGLPTLEAARLGVYAHGRAADLLLARRHIRRGLLARDLVEALPEALALTQP